LFTPLLWIVTTAWQCSLEQGQIYIDEGRYRDAIREFTWVIEGQPTEVEATVDGSGPNCCLVAIPVLSATTPHNRLRAAGPSGYAAMLTAAPDDYSRSHRRELRSLVLFRLSCGDPLAQ